MRVGSVLPLLLAVGLLGCSGPAVHFTLFDTAYTGSEVRYASREGVLLVEAIGGPSGAGDSAALSETIADLLTRSGPAWFSVRYTADAADSEVDGLYRLRWLFDVPLGFPVASACADDMPARAGAWSEETGRVVAALCRKGEYLSLAQGAVGQAGRGNPDAFARTVGMMARDVLPLRSPDERDDCNRLVVCG